MKLFLSTILKIFHIFEMRTHLITNEKYFKSFKKITDRREIESISTSLYFSSIDVFRSDLSIFKFFKTFIMRNTSEGQTSTEQIANLVEELLICANPETFIEAVNYGFLTSIKDEMKTFKLSGKEISSKVFLNQNLIAFFYKLEALKEKGRLEKRLDNINHI